MTVLEKCHQRGHKTRRGRSGGDEGKIQLKSSEVNTRVISRGQSKLTCEFKMAEGDVLERSFNPTPSSHKELVEVRRMAEGD